MSKSGAATCGAVAPLDSLVCACVARSGVQEARSRASDTVVILESKMSRRFFSQSSLLSPADDHSTVDVFSFRDINREAEMAAQIKPTDDGAPREAALPDLNDDILHLVFGYLAETNPATIPALARVSRSFNALATPYLYYTLTISDPPSSPTSFAEPILHHLQNEAEVIGKHVRHLIVEKVPDNVNLVKVIRNMGNLQTLEYVPMPIQ
jgi:hypothetical protein